METSAPKRRMPSVPPRAALAVLIGAVLVFQLGCPVPIESTNLNPAIFGQTVIFTGSVSTFGPPPTGIMDFLDGSTTLAAGVPLDASGKAVFATSTLAIGSHSMTVHYYGDANYAPGDSTPIIQVVRAAASSFYTITPCRLVDTRQANGPVGGPSLAASQGRTFPLAGSCNIPSNAAALSVNVTIIGSTAPGFVTLYAGGTPQPAVSSLNFSPGQVRANNAIVTLGALGDVTAYLGQGAGKADLVIDVNGYLQ